MSLSRNPEKKPKGATTSTRDATLRGFSPQGSHLGGQFKPPARTRRGSLSGSVRVKLPVGLKRDVEDIVQFLDLWSNPTEFIREAIRHERNRWIDEARGVKEQLEEGAHDPWHARGPTPSPEASPTLLKEEDEDG